MVAKNKQLALTRVAWLIDPDSDFDVSLLPRVLAVLRNIVDQKGCSIEPIRVPEPNYLRALIRNLFRHGKPPPQLPDHYDRYEILPMHTFDWGRVNGKSLSYFLSCYGQLNHVDLFIVPTQLSFRDLLCVESKIPLLFVNPDDQLPSRIKHILHPVLNPKRYNENFGSLIELAKLLGARITLLHRRPGESKNKIWIPNNEEFDTIPFYDPEVLEAELAALTVISSWVKLAREKDVQIELKFTPGTNRYDKSILNMQKKLGCDLIAFDPSSFLTEQNSSLLQVVREAKCPIWVARPMGQSRCKESLRILENRLLGRTG